MPENVIERMERIDGKRRIADFMVKEKMPYDFKVSYAKIRAQEFVRECEKRDLNYHVSVGGLDSITLFLSKEIAAKIETLANPTEKNATVRHAIITGETGAYGGFQKNSRMKMSQKWLEKFAGYANAEEGTDYSIAPFQVSSKCCYYLKEKPCDDWAKAHNSVPFLGLMASEGGRRAKSLRLNGCNYFGKSTIRSAPFAIFSRQDLLQLALDLNVPVPEIYGSIERTEDGQLYTTKAQRTGCSMCGFGIHLEKRPHRFDLLKERNPKEWEYWMFKCCTDPITGEKFGWARVLDYIGVDY